MYRLANLIAAVIAAAMLITCVAFMIMAMGPAPKTRGHAAPSGERPWINMSINDTASEHENDVPLAEEAAQSTAGIIQKG